MIHPYITGQIARERRRDLLATASRQQARRQARRPAHRRGALAGTLIRRLAAALASAATSPASMPRHARPGGDGPGHRALSPPHGQPITAGCWPSPDDQT